jgi:CIC family chloride channel protein
MNASSEKENKANLEAEPEPLGLSLRDWRQLILSAGAVGLAAGLIVSLFGFLLDRVDALRETLILWARSQASAAGLIPILFIVLCSGISVLLVRKIAPQAGGGGVPFLQAALRDGRTLGWEKLLPVKFTACLFALGSGLLLGRVGPAVQLGAAGGDALAQRLKFSAEKRRLLLTAGAGAGLAAIYNVPAAGLAFSLEVLRGRFSLPAFISGLAAAGLADLTTRLLRGSDASFSMPMYTPVPALSLPWFALLGIAAGLFGWLYRRGLLGSLGAVSKLQGKWLWARVIVLSALVGLAGWLNLDWAGGGHRLTETALSGQLAFRVIPLLLAVRLALTILSLSSGAPGGIVAPLLALGALAGLLFGQALERFAPIANLQPAVFAVGGMAALFAGVVRAPITAVLLAVEMTGDFYLILPLAIACLCAEWTSRLVKSRPIYSELAQLLPDTRHKPLS